MPFPVEWEKFLWEGILFLTYIIICGSLIQLRFSKKTSLLAAGITIAGIVVLQAILLSFKDPTFVLTLFPLTVYLPVIICLHILSRSGFFQTMAIWTIGTIVYFVLKTIWKILLVEQFVALPGWGYSLLIIACLLLASGLMIFFVLRFLRKPFQTYVLNNHTNWLLLCFPILMIFLLFSYVSGSTTDKTMLFLLLLTTCSIFLVIIRVLTSAASIAQMKEAEKSVSAQMQIQRREYEDVCKKMELGRTYRHDMRHHLLALESLAKQGHVEKISKYIENLSCQLSNIEKEFYCENTTINAVLAACIGQAKKADCSVTAKIRLPEELPFDEMDICVVLANTLENAVNACQEINPKEKRLIQLTVELTDNRKLIISVENPCEKQLAFNTDGFPIVPKRDGHGIGLKSVNAVVKKYNGMFQCTCRDGQFLFKAVLFELQNQISSQQKKKKTVISKKLASATLSVLTLFLLINCMPTMAEALSELPGIGVIVKIIDLRSYRVQWGDTVFNANYPNLIMETFPNIETNTPIKDNSPTQTPELTLTPSPTTSAPVIETPTPSPTNNAPEETQQPAATPPLEPTASPTPSVSPDDPNGIEDINQKIEEYIEAMREKFLWYVSRKYEGYVGMDIVYQIVHNDDRLLSVRFDATLNVGGSAQYSRSFTLDKNTGKILELSSLFLPESDYIGVISQEILRQMKIQMEAGVGDYFIPGSIWPQEDYFDKIDADQNFYINDKNQLVIVFDEYEVASGNMGMPEFIIETDIIKDILQQPSILS